MKKIIVLVVVVSLLTGCSSLVIEDVDSSNINQNENYNFSNTNNNEYDNFDMNYDINNENKIRIDFSRYELLYEDYKDVVETLKNNGFTNIVEEPIYDIILGFTKEGEVDDVIIDGKNRYSNGDYFEKDVQILVQYHMKESSDPTIEFITTNVDSLNKALEENAAVAKEKYYRKYVKVKGELRNIDSDLEYISIGSLKNEWDFETVLCSIEDEATKEKVKTLKTGDTIVVKGKITRVGEVLGYSMDIIEIIK